MGVAPASPRARAAASSSSSSAAAPWSPAGATAAPRAATPTSSTALTNTSPKSPTARYKSRRVAVNFFWPRPATNSPSTANQRPIKEPPAVPLARVGVWPRAAAAGGGRSRNSSPLCRGTRGAADPGISPRLRRRVGIPGRQLNPPPGTSAGCRRPPPSVRGPTPGLWSARALGLRAAGQRLGGWRHARPCV